MIFPSRRAKLLESTAPVEVWVYSREDLGLDGRSFSSAAEYVTGPIFAAGVTRWSLLFFLAGGGLATIVARPLDEFDSTDTAFELAVATGIAAGWRRQTIDPGLVVTSFRLIFRSSGNNSCTGALFGLVGV